MVPTASVLQGLAALAVHDRERRAGDDVVAMAEAAAAPARRACMVAESRGADLGRALPTRATCWAGRRRGGADRAGPGRRRLWLAHRMLTTGGELVTVLLGEGADDPSARGSRPTCGAPIRRSTWSVHRGGPADTRWSWGWSDRPRHAAAAGLVGRKAARRAGRAAGPAHGRRPAAALPAPLRRTAASSPTSPGLELGEHVTVMAEVEKATLRRCAARRGQLLAVVIGRRGGRLDCTFFNRPPAQGRAHARPAGAVRRQGRRVPGQAAAHPPAVRAAATTTSDDVRPFAVDLPGHRQAAVLEDRTLRAPGARPARRPHRPAAGAAARAERGCPVWARRCAASTCPRPRRTSTPRRHRLVWDEAMGVQLALALRRQATRRPPGRAVPAPARAGCWTPSTRALPFTLTAGQRDGRRGDRRRPGRRRTR